jgi:hypothetical protein
MPLNMLKKKYQTHDKRRYHNDLPVALQVRTTGGQSYVNPTCRDLRMLRAMGC